MPETAARFPTDQTRSLDMTPATANATSRTVDSRLPRPTRRVVDAPTRMFHWLFAFCFVGAYLTSDGDSLRLVHVALGYTMAGLLGWRVLYGLLGPRQARLSALWARVKSAPGWLRAVKAAWLGGRNGDGARPAAVNWRQGQNLVMATAVVGILALVAPLTLSGYATFNEWGGEWLEEVHEALGEALLWLVLLHLAMIVGLSLLRRANQAAPMLTGRVEGAGPDLARRNHAWLAILLLAGVLSWWVWEWQHPPASPADKPGASSHHARGSDRHRERH